MSGGGASAGEIDTYTKDLSSRVLLGFDQTDYHGWDGEEVSSSNAAFDTSKPYSLAPGALRFVYERGITDKGGNPYEGVDTYDPDTDLADMDTKIDALSTHVEAVAPATDWGALADSISTKAGTVSPALDTSALLQTVTAEAVARMLPLFISALQQAKEEFADVQDITAEQAAKLSASIVQRSSTEMRNVVQQAIDAATSSSPAATILSDASTYTTSTMSTLLAAVPNDAMPIVAQGMLTLEGMSGQIVQSAMNTALSVIAQESVEKAVAAYRKRALVQHNRAVNRFAGGMADINAVQSSTFVLGLAMLESDFSNAVSDFQAKLELDLYNQAVPRFLEVYQTALRTYIEVYMGRLQSYIQTAGMSLPTYVQAAMGILPEFMRTYIAGVGSYLDVYKQGAAQGADGTLRVAGVQSDLLQQAIARELQSSVQVKVSEKSDKTQFMLDSMRSVLSLTLAKLEGERTVAAMFQDYNKVKIVAKSEEIEKNLEIDAKDSLWDLDLFQTLGNMVAAGHGGVVPLSHGPTRTQSAIGGMAAGAGKGAAIGSLVPGIGTTVGAGVGALAGLIAGL